MYLEPVESKIEAHSYLKNNAEFANILILPLFKNLNSQNSSYTEYI